MRFCGFRLCHPDGPCRDGKSAGHGPLLIDHLVGGAYRAAAELGRRVGSDFAVVGFDNIPQPETLRPPSTTIDIHPARIGRMAAEAVIALLVSWERKRRQMVVEPELVIRWSVARLA